MRSSSTLLLHPPPVAVETAGRASGASPARRVGVIDLTE